MSAKPERKVPAGTITGMPARDTTWQTPPELLEPVRAYFGGAIPFDPATTPDNPTGAISYATEDGLTRDWSCGPIPGVFVNPPYGRVLRDWLAKIAEEARRGVTIISLLPCARWEQAYFQDTLICANAACFIRKRVAFIKPSTGDRVSGNPYANMFLAFNVDVDAFCQAFAPYGAVVAIDGLAGPPAVTPRVRTAPRSRVDTSATERPRRFISFVPEEE